MFSEPIHFRFFPSLLGSFGQNGEGAGKMKRDRKRIRGKENWRGKRRGGEKRREKEGGEDQQPPVLMLRQS